MARYSVVLIIMEDVCESANHTSSRTVSPLGCPPREGTAKKSVFVFGQGEQNFLAKTYYVLPG